MHYWLRLLRTFKIWNFWKKKFRKKAWYFLKIANCAKFLIESISNCNFASKLLKTFKIGYFLEKKVDFHKKPRKCSQKNGKIHLECVPKVLLLLKTSQNFQILAFPGKIDHLKKIRFKNFRKRLISQVFFSNASRNSLLLMCSGDVQNVGFFGKRDVFFAKTLEVVQKCWTRILFFRMPFKMYYCSR